MLVSRSFHASLSLNWLCRFHRLPVLLFSSVVAQECRPRPGRKRRGSRFSLVARSRASSSTVQWTRRLTTIPRPQITLRRRGIELTLILTIFTGATSFCGVPSRDMCCLLGQLCHQFIRMTLLIFRNIDFPYYFDSDSRLSLEVRVGGGELA